MQIKNTIILFKLLIIISNLNSLKSASAQVIPDSTLGSESSQVIRNQQIKSIQSDFIQGGARRGNILFHSLQKLNIQQGRGAYFANPSGVLNIITRITGKTPTEIKGTLGVLGNANFILISPSGIKLQNGAKFDLNGSIALTTASELSINKINFSAINPENITPGITIEPPLIGGFYKSNIDLIFDGNSSLIEIQGDGHILDVGLLTRGRDPSRGPQVKAKQNIILLGNDIQSRGGVFTAEGGRIDIGSIRSGKITLTPNEFGWTTNYKKVTEFGTINLSKTSLFDASSPQSNTKNISAGSINLKCKQCQISEGSIILLQNRGLQSSGNIQVKAIQLFEIEGFSPKGESSRLLSESLGNGQGGDIIVSAPHINIRDKGDIITNTSGIGNGGNINISTTNLKMSDNNTSPIAIGDTTILALSSNIGRGGNIEIEALENINISDSNVNILSQTFGVENGGNISLKFKSLTLEDGARIGSNVFATSIARSFTQADNFYGKGGNVTLTGENIKVIGNFVNQNLNTSELSFSSIDSNTFGDGDAGDLVINASLLKLEKQGQIRANTFSNGNAGNVYINVSNIIVDRSDISVSTELANSTTRSRLALPELPNGNPGTLEINSSSLKLINQGQITSINEGNGNGGNLRINSKNINLNKGQILSTSNSGVGGNIDINANTLFLRDNSLISATAFGDNSASNGGNININADLTILLNSNIFARAVRGRGGDISLSGSGVFLDSFSSIDASSQFGQDGTITIDVPQSLRTLVGGINKPSEIIVSVAKSLEICPEGKVRRGKFKVGTGTSTPYTPKNKIDRYELFVEDISPSQSGSENPQQAQIPFILTHPESYEPGFFYPAPNVGVRFPDGRTAVATEGYASPKTLEELICQPQKLPKDF